MSSQFKFFDDAGANEDAARMLEGFKYSPSLIGPEQEKEFLARVSELFFKPFEFHGYTGKRRVVSFGWQYEFSGAGKLRKAEDIPPFVLPLREQVGSFANIEPAEFEHVLVIEYGPGAGIGWHRDKPVFGQVVGVSLLAPCILRFRRKLGEKWDRTNVLAEPRSAYLLTGPARSEWEHSILRVDSLRYSITFRTLRPVSDAL
jgi:alkylated DNA repair dioxygenase AlkB